MRYWQTMLMGAALAALPAAARAQYSNQAQPAPVLQTLQRSFIFLEHSLRVTIAGEAPGSIEVVRGEAGRIDLSAQAPGIPPVAAISASSPGQLMLVADGTGPVQYVLVVPSDARVTVAREGHPGVSLGTLDRSARWSWPGQTSPTRQLPH